MFRLLVLPVLIQLLVLYYFCYYRLRGTIQIQEYNIKMYLSILLLTLFASIISAILSITIYYEVGLCNSPVLINVISWVDSGILNV